MKASGRRSVASDTRLHIVAVFFACLFLFSPILSAAVAAPAGRAAANEGQGRYLVGFKQSVGARDTGLLRSANAQVYRRFHLLPAVAARMSPQAAARLAANPRVSFVEPDIRVRELAQEVPWGITRIGAPMVHSIGNTGAGVKVAIIDTGIDYNHPDLAPNYKGGYDFCNEDDDPWDDRGHGTHCAGIAAAADNSEGVIGVAPDAWLYGLKMLDANGEGDLSDGIAAIEWCVDNGIDVASMSWGAPNDPISQALVDACDAAYAAGLTMVAAAGNDGYGANTVNQPAILDTVIAVAATDQTDSWAYFSSTGPAVELAAPGMGILSTWPGGGYATYDGTSMACPHVTGVVALTIASGISSPSAIRDRLQKTAEDLGAPGWDEYFGYGLVRADWAAGGYEVIVTGINPNLASNDEVVSVTISGLGFEAGAVPHLAMSGQSPIFGTDVTVVSDTEITCHFNLLGAAGGAWDVVVTNPDNDSGMLPEGFYVMGAVDEDFETGDLSRWPWVTHGDALWTVSEADSHTGTYAARAGSMSGEGSSYLEITLDCEAGVISFFKKLSCPGGMLIFYVDDAAIGEWSGVSDWDTTPVEYAVSEGTHTFKWEYWDLLGDPNGTVWLDDINFPPLSGEHLLNITSGPSGTPNPVGPSGDVVCTVTAYDSLGHDLVYEWSADAGSFDNTSVRSPTWTAPATAGDYQITVTVTCSEDETISATSSYTQGVSDFIVTGITPDSGLNDEVVSVTITGLGFEEGATTRLVKAGESSIPGTGVAVVSGTQINCDLNLVGAAEGAWDVVVTNPDAESATLSEGFTVMGAVDEDFETGDLSKWPWVTYGDALWTVSDASPRTGTYAARAGSMSAVGSSFLEITLDCEAGVISFYRKLSSAGGLLIFYVDGASIGEWSGISDWDTTPVEYAVAAGTHTFKWEYWDLVGDPPSTVWLDDISFPPLAGQQQHSVTITTGPSGTPNPVASGGDVACSVTAEDSDGHDLNYQWSASDGSFNDATLASPTWTAPVNASGATASCQVTVTVTCAEDANVSDTGGFTQQVQALAPTVTSITPFSGLNTETVSITDLEGTGFGTGATVKLEKSGETAISGSSVTVVDSTQITCQFDLTGAAVGLWDVTVTNPDGQSATLADGFEVQAGDISPPDIVGWEISAVHGGVGELRTVISDGAVESRIIAVDCLVVHFDEPLDAATFTPSAVSIVGITNGDQSALVSSVVLEGDGSTARITLSGTLPEPDRYTVTISTAVCDLAGNPLGGDRDVEMICLHGDANGDGTVDIGDRLAVQARYGLTVDETSCRYDVNGNGTIDIGDTLAVQARYGHKAPAVQ